MPCNATPPNARDLHAIWARMTQQPQRRVRAARWVLSGVAAAAAFLGGRVSSRAHKGCTCYVLFVPDQKSGAGGNLSTFTERAASDPKIVRATAE